MLAIPNFKYDLLSMSQLTKQLLRSIVFFPDFCVLQDLSTGKVKGIGKESGGLYWLMDPNNNHPSSSNGPELMNVMYTMMKQTYYDTRD